MNEINNQPACFHNTAMTNAATASGNAVLHFASTLADDKEPQTAEKVA
jgi:hypothetical protein